MAEAHQVCALWALPTERNLRKRAKSELRASSRCVVKSATLLGPNLFFLPCPKFVPFFFFPPQPSACVCIVRTFNGQNSQSTRIHILFFGPLGCCICEPQVLGPKCPISIFWFNISATTLQLLPRFPTIIINITAQIAEGESLALALIFSSFLSPWQLFRSAPNAFSIYS